MDYRIIGLDPSNYGKLANIWDMERHAELAKRFYAEIISGNRKNYVFEAEGEYIGEISLVFDKNDPDYTIAGKRIYVSRLIVKPTERRKGVGRALVDFAIVKARELGYSEMSIGVDIDNYPAIRLYWEKGFDRILFVGEDEDGKYFKLLKQI